HLMDAVPVTLGQEFGGYAAAVRYGAERVGAIVPRLGELPLGGTAVGTGLNAPPGFATRVNDKLAVSMKLPLTEARNHFEAQGSRDALVEASGVLRVIAVSLYKICNDLRWMGSGPRAGLGEITALPDRMRHLVESSPVIVTALNRYIGYEAAAQVAHEALESGETIRSIVIARGYVERGEITSEQLDAALDVLAMTRPAERG